MDAIIQVTDLKKCYGDHQVLKGISLTIQKGEIFALLGINGAGKTTTLECMEGLRTYEEGVIQINGSFGVQLQSASIPKEAIRCPIYRSEKTNSFGFGASGQSGYYLFR